MTLASPAHSLVPNHALTSAPMISWVLVPVASASLMKEGIKGVTESSMVIVIAWVIHQGKRKFCGFSFEALSITVIVAVKLDCHANESPCKFISWAVVFGGGGGDPAACPMRRRREGIV
jgi:hypothetical protein